MVPSRLLAFQSDLVALDPERDQVAYTAENWQRYFEDDADLAEILRRFPDVLTPSDLKTISLEATSDQRKVRMLFLATMMWAQGTVGQGPFHTYYMVTDPDFDAILPTVVLNVGWGQIAEAYQQCRIRRCGPDLFTKLFYIVGLASGPDPLPLILDAPVAKSLQRLFSDADVPLQIDDFVKGTTANARYPEGYLNYIQLLNGWSYELGCRPDAVERFLSKPPASFKQWEPPPPP